MVLWNKVPLVLLLLLGFSIFARAESYGLLDANVRSLQAKIEDKQKKIKELADKKTGVKDRGAQVAIMDEMVVEAREMKEAFVRFQKEKKRLKYQFPDRGEETERKYRRFEIQTVEELNSFSNIDLRLKGVLGRVHRTYGPPPEVIQKQEEQKAQKVQESGRLQSKEKDDSLMERPKLSY